MFDDPPCFVGQPLSNDPFFTVGRVDSHERPTVITTAILDNPAQVEFFGCGNSVTTHKVVHTKFKVLFKLEI